MPNLLVAVGGSGQHVALAVSRLTFIGALPKGNRCVIVDADTASPLSEATMSFDGFVHQKHRTNHPLAGAESFLRPFDASQAAAVGGAGGTSFRSLFLRKQESDEPQASAPERGGNGKDTSADVFDALYTPRDARQDVLEGFYARPTLGASCFAAQADDIVNRIAADAESAEKVLLCGSFIGGTGAGVIPALVRRTANPDKWFGAFHLLWMDPPSSGADEIKRDDLDRNMRHGLSYYYDWVVPRLRASVLMGAPLSEGGVVERVTPTSGGETPSFYHVLAATALHHFSEDTTTPYDHSVVVYSHDTSHPAAILDRTWYGGQTLRTRLFTARRAEALLGYYCRDEGRVQALVKAINSKFGVNVEVPEGLRRSLKDFAKVAGYKGAFGGVDEAFIRNVVEAMDHRREALRRTITYFETVFRAIGEDPLFDHLPGNELETLRSLWQESEPPPQVDRKEAAETFAPLLAERLVDRLLADAR